MVVVGIDVGGTFTDLTEIDEATGAVRITKVPSTPNDEAHAVMSGLERIADPRQVRRVVHGTTVATNAIIQRRGARVAFVTTAGFKDLIEIGRTKRNIPALFNPTFVRPKPPVERPLRFEVGERMLGDGSVLRPLDEGEVRRLCEEMRRSRVEAFAVCLLFSYANPAHEQKLGEALARAFPDVPVSLSSDVVQEYREFERFSTTVFNAYIRPLMERYLESLEKKLVAAGYPPGVLTVGSSGGALTIDAARRLPIKTISSGPAGGVSQAIFLARGIAVPNLITYDIGGTSTDVCLISDYEAVVTTETMLAAFPVKTAQIDIKSVGAGGGSIAWVDVDASLQVGPHSAGAEPGPACYGRGGREATVSDANLLLGRLSATQPLGGTIRPDPALATEVIARLADRLGGFDLHRLADGIIRIMVARTVSSIREITIQRGHDPRDFELMAFGGAGGMHAIPTAEELGISRIIVPRFPGNFSALGVAASDIKHDAVRTHITLLAGALPAIRAMFADMRASAARQLQQDGFGPAETRFAFSLDLRYLGQAFELNLAVDAETSTVADIIRAFHGKHLQTYGHMNEGASVELVNMRLTAYGVVVKAPLPRYRGETTRLADALREERAVYFDDAFVRCPVYDRDRLPEGAVLVGPAIVEEFGSTTVIFPAWQGRVDEFGNLRLERRSCSEAGVSPTASVKADPITVEVVREALSSIVREMRVNLVRTSYSSILYEGEDFSCVLMNANAEIVAMSAGQDHPLHIVPIGWSMKAVREKFGEDIRPGDIFLHNDPYTGGTHLNDVAMIYPMFADGDLLLFPVIRAHWADVGGMTSGSISGAVTEIYQEGVRIPPIKVVEQGRLNQPVLDVLFANMRIPKDRDGDFRAMVGTCKKAAERVEALLARYGLAAVRACIKELLDRAEHRMRQRIRELPDGTYAYEAYLEGGRERLEPLVVRAAVTIAGDAVTVDLSGTAPQTAGPTNVGPAMAPTGAFTIIKSFLDPGGDINSGAFRPLSVITPEGTIVNARPPAPCGGMVEVKCCVESAVMGALAQAIGGRVTGDLKGGGNHAYLGGVDPRTREPFVFYEYPAAGNGAWDGGDGNNAVRAFTESDMTTLQPVEAVEQKYPLRVERTLLRDDSGGDGRWRGGLGLSRELTLLGPDARFSVLSEKNVLPPYGVCGGMSGAPNRFFVIRDGQEVEPSTLPGKVSGFPVREGDLILLQSSGGGGYGDPLERDPKAVVHDVAEGVVSRQKAETVYGAVFTGAAIDPEATRRRRQEIRAARARVRLRELPGPVYRDGRRVCRISAAVAAKLALRAGDIVEFVDPVGAPLRAWVDGIADDAGDLAWLAADVLPLLTRAVEEIELRRASPRRVR